MISEGSIGDISSWQCDNAGIYRYWIHDTICYEIQVATSDYSRGFTAGIFNAKCNLFLVITNDKEFSRAYLAQNKNLVECIQVAYETRICPEAFIMQRYSNQYMNPYVGYDMLPCNVNQEYEKLYNAHKPKKKKAK